ncbi:trypsin domain-containing protein [Phthorimaea operculella]|nr:trypsin domain-containing protein [Phthorimaea operculella]
MNKLVIVLTLCVVASSAGPSRNGGQRIVGGDVTTIDQYPFIAAMLVTYNGEVFTHNCGGSILNEKTILSAAHCYSGSSNAANRWRVRVGSSFRSSGGVVHNVARIINHPQYNENAWNHDISVLHLETFMSFNNVVQQVQIAGPSYFPADNDRILTIGWGLTSFQGTASEQLKHVEQRVMNQQQCTSGFAPGIITDTMLCITSVSNVDGGPCSQDSGGPNVHNNVLVGVTAFTLAPCGEAGTPSSLARVSSYVDWILANVFTN